MRRLIHLMGIAMIAATASTGGAWQVPGQDARGRYPLTQQIQQSFAGEAAAASNSPAAESPVHATTSFAPSPQESVGMSPIATLLSAPQEILPTPDATIGSTQFQLAAQPPLGASYFHDGPRMDGQGMRVEYDLNDFGPDPTDSKEPYDSESSIWVYRGKTANRTQRPLIELGRPWFAAGPFDPAGTLLGETNLLSPQFILFGDFRVAAASNQLSNDHTDQIALEANFNFDWKVTATERVHFFISPLDRRGRNSRWLLDQDEFVGELDPNVEFGFLEGDLGAIVGGMSGQTLPFDFPFAAGFMPLVIQNGIWFEDAIIGVAATIPARNSPRLNISNMDTTFFWGYDELESRAFGNEDGAAKVYGMANFIEAWGGYWEMDYAFLEDRNSSLDRSYHNIALAYTRRYGRWLSNSMRVVSNAGQSIEGGSNTADGFVVLIENSLVTAAPYTVVPYCNWFYGSDRPQSAARDPGAGDILKNTGILFEADGMTGFPTLDATANDTYGAALGINLLSADFCQQLVLEGAFLQVHGNDATRIAVADQYGLGIRYQRPLNNAVILRLDGMIGFLEDADDINGFRIELRHKF